MQSLFGIRDVIICCDINYNCNIYHYFVVLAADPDVISKYAR